MIDGRYEVESTLGVGGMGVVLAARHKFTGAKVALKMLQPDLQLNQDAKERFLAEARTPSTIGHAGIVQVLDAGLTPEGELYLAMELLTGRTLRQALRAGLAAETSRRILLELLDALGAAHARGIVHRDLKPENVFLAGESETVKLLDFGIAKVLETSRTVAGAMLGTPSYMAPEQLSDARSVDARADLWAVGVIAYELVSGTLPYPRGQFGDMVQALATRDPDPIRGHVANAPPELERFFGRALSRDRDQRFASAGEMSDAIRGIPLVTARRANPPTPAPLLPSAAPVAGDAPTVDSFAPSSPPPSAPAPAPAPPAQRFVPSGASLPAYSPRPAGAPQPSPYSPHVPPHARSAAAMSSPDMHPPRRRGALGVHWYLIAGAVMLVIVVVAVIAVSSRPPIDPAGCRDDCRALSDCVDVDLCAASCTLEPEVRDCLEEADGECSTYQRCVSNIRPSN